MPAARHVVVTDLNPVRLELARKMGATLAIESDKDAASKRCRNNSACWKASTWDWRCRAMPTAFREMLDNMSHGGKIAMLGIPSKELAIDWNQVIFNMLTIKGIYGREMYETWYKMTVMVESGLDITPVITHRLRCEEFEKGFDAMREGSAGKVILNWTAAR